MRANEVLNFINENVLKEKRSFYWGGLWKLKKQIYIRENETISKLCHILKKIYKKTNYILRRQFLENEKSSSYVDLVKLFQTPSNNDEENNY